MHFLNSWSLAKKINLVVLSTITLIFIIFAGICISEIRKDVLGIEQQNLQSNTEQIAKAADWWLEGFQMDLLREASDSSWTTMLKKGDTAFLSENLQRLKDADQFLSNAFIADNKGVIVAGAVPGTAGRDVTTYEFWKGIQAGKNVSMDFHPFKSPVNGMPIFVVAVPLLDGAGNRTGILAFSVNLKAYSEEFITTRVFG